MTRPDGSVSLPCGADVNELSDQVVGRLPARDAEHQAACPYCRATIAELRTLWSPLHALADEDVAAPKELVARVLEQILELDIDGGRAVIAADRGDTSIGVQVIATIARKAADSVSGTLLAFSRARADVQVGAAGRSVVVQVEIVAALGMSLPMLSAQIQRTVRDHVAALTGLSVVAVDVSMVEVAGGRPAINSSVKRRANPREQ